MAISVDIGSQAFLFLKDRVWVIKLRISTYKSFLNLCPISL
jgi:hypothetical protein